MAAATQRGTIAYVNYDKGFGTIEYRVDGIGKEKSVNFKTDAHGNNKKPQSFRVGDTVSFELKLSDRGDKMTAVNIQFHHNTAIDLLLQKAAIENRFAGYLKKVDDKYFIKEWESYIFFPLQLSPWEKPPAETAENEAISFRFVRLDKPNSLAAELFSHTYIPEYRQALQHYNHKIEIDATISKLTPYGVHLHLFGEAFQAKLPRSDEDREWKVNDTVRVKITYLSPAKVVVEEVK